MSDYLFLVKIKYNLRIHSFVLMPNHFHLIATSLEHPIGQVMCELMTNSSKEINRMSGRINQSWGGRHFKCELSSYHYYLNCYKYVYQNPVRAKLCEYSEAWKYSSLNGLVGLSQLIIPVEEDVLLFDSGFSETSLKWLNTKITEENILSMRMALQKKSFKLPKINGNTANKLEKDLI